MKKVSYVLSIFIVMILFSVMCWKLYPKRLQANNVTVAVPLPKSLLLAFNPQITTLDIWQPKGVLVETTDASAPKISAISALAYDESTDQFLYAKAPHSQLPMASLTKVMTAIIAVENAKSSDSYTVPSTALVGEDSMGLVSGEILSLKELLYGLFLHSANDAAETLAANYLPGRDAYIQAMNDKVKALGLSDTHFTNPTGLEGEGRQYSSAYDLMVISRYALTFPVIREVAESVNYTIPQTSTHQEYDLQNETNLLTTYSGVKGLKTGYTPEAGYCLITYLRYQGHDIIAILLGSNNRRDEMKQMLDYSLKKLQIVPPPHD